MTGCPRLVIGATGSGVGKTSVAVALAAALRRCGRRVQTFKAGPDFLDPAWLAAASGRPCFNLDGWMCGEEYVRRLFAEATEDCDIALVEGVMGLFDGASATSIEGSTAEVARWLDAPVLLVVNAQGASRSVAAMVAGFAGFEPGVRVGGVVANGCGSARHAEWMAEALRAAGEAPLLGALPRGALPVLPSRHLGLAGPGVEPDLQAFARAAAEHLRLDEVVALAESANPMEEAGVGGPGVTAPQVRLGVAMDAAFHFYYPDNLAALEAAGARLVEFSPLTASALPEGLDGLYLGGGYPEEQAAALAGNAAMRDAVRRFAESGRPVYAECGGLMYLAQGIEMKNGERFPMAGVLPVWTRMLARRKALGYVEVAMEDGSPWAERGAVMRGHEFHYSEFVGEEGVEAWRPAYRLRRRRETEWQREGFRRGGVLASYVHLHFASHPGAAGRFVAACKEAR